MPGCVLRVQSVDFDAGGFLQTAGWQPLRAYDDGFNLVVSESEDLDTQIDEALEFLRGICPSWHR